MTTYRIIHVLHIIFITTIIHRIKFSVCAFTQFRVVCFSSTCFRTTIFIYFIFILFLFYILGDLCFWVVFWVLILCCLGEEGMGSFFCVWFPISCVLYLLLCDFIHICIDILFVFLCCFFVFCVYVLCRLFIFF